VQANYYKHSGRFSAASIALGLGGGLFAAVLLGVVYGQGMARIPVVGKITFVIAALAGAGYGAASASLFRAGRGRSTGLGAVMALLAALVGHYVAWVAWLSVVLSRNDVEGPSMLAILADPASMFAAIGRINDVGAWSVGGSAPSGAMLSALWGIEALIVVGTGLAVGAGIASGGVYCEQCGNWCKEDEGRVLLNPAPAELVKQHLEAQDFSVLNQIGPLAAPGPSLRLDLAYCEKCEKTHAVAVNAVAPKSDGNGVDVDTVVSYLHTTPEVSRWLRSIPKQT
jgi:hypothetical protein